MPLDPSIISSYNPGPGIDVNALMQQRMQGMENINALERQRRADDLAMQDRAALQQERAAAAQEDALVKALLPAYTYGIETGDLAGALDLVPPEMQENILPYVQALEGKSPEQVRSALIGSLSTSKAGQEALAAMQRAATYNIQNRQQTLAEQKYETELAGAGQPKPMSEYEKAQLGFREREVALKEEEAAAKNAAPEGMDPKTKLKLDQSLPKATSALRSAINAYDNDITDVKALLEDDAGINAITGAFGSRTPDVLPDATRAAGLLNKIKAGAMFSALQELRLNSPTGAGVGNVSNEEGRKLQESMAALDRAQSPEDFKRALAKFAIDLDVARRSILAAFDDTYGYRDDVSALSIEEETRAARGAAEREMGKTSLPPGGFRILKQR